MSHFRVYSNTTISENPLRPRLLTHVRRIDEQSTIFMYRRITDPDPDDIHLQVATADGNTSITYRRMFPVELSVPGLVWQPLGAPTPDCFEALTAQEPLPQPARKAVPVDYSDYVRRFLDQQERKQFPQIILKEKEYETSRYYMYVAHDRGERKLIAEDT
jgi:hypothetical protein